MNTLPIQNTLVQFVADGVTADYIFDFQFGTYVPSDADLLVYVTPPGQDPIPQDDIQTLDVDYTVSFNPEYIGGTVIFDVDHIPLAGAIVTIQLNVSSALEVEFSAVQTFNGANLDSALYQIFLNISQLYSFIAERAISYRINTYLPPSTVLPNTQLPLLGNNQIWKGQGDGVIATTLVTNDSTLRSDLANNSPGTAGATLVGYHSNINGATTVDAELTYLDSTITNQIPTGVRWDTYAVTAPAGWVMMDDGTIGNASSGATTRANADTEDLFELLWNSYADVYCPVLPGGRGANAIADFAANKTINLPRVIGRLSATAGQATVASNFIADYTTSLLTVVDTTIFYTGSPVQLTNTGGSLPTGLSLATTYYVVIHSASQIYLASSTVNAVAAAVSPSGNVVTFSNNGSGTNTLNSVFTNKPTGSYEGEQTHLDTQSEMPGHTHSQEGANSQEAPTGSGQTFVKEGTTQVGSAGGSQPHNNMPPVSYCNTMIKL
jgi:hypothetical protein